MRRSAKQGEMIEGMAKDPTKYEATAIRRLLYDVLFPAMTRFGDDDLAKLASVRNNLFNRILWPNQNE